MKITFTGVDAWTTRNDIERLLQDPRVELGILFSLNPQGRNRYPSVMVIRTLLEDFGPRMALHICGSEARQDVFSTIPMFWEMYSGVSRIQVNGNPHRHDIEELCGQYPEKQIITQHKPGNEALLTVRAPNHTVLIDASGGRGNLPREWQRPVTSKDVGFAGGLGPDTIREQLPRIRMVAQDPFWIDMENGVRTDDRFDVAKCQQVLETIRSMT